MAKTVQIQTADEKEYATNELQCASFKMHKTILSEPASVVCATTYQHSLSLSFYLIRSCCGHCNLYDLFLLADKWIIRSKK